MLASRGDAGCLSGFASSGGIVARCGRRSRWRITNARFERSIEFPRGDSGRCRCHADQHHNNDRAVERLLRDHGDEASAFICYTQALFAFRKSGDSADARRLAAEAWHSNIHVPRLLSKKGRVRYEDTGYYTMGGEDEAAHYLEEYGFAWKETPGAVEWLVEVTGDLNPVQRGRGNLH